MAGLNLVNRVVPDGQLEDTAGALVDRLAVGPPAAYAATKTLLRLWSVGGPSAAKAALYDIYYAALRCRGCSGRPQISDLGRTARKTLSQGLVREDGLYKLIQMFSHREEFHHEGYSVFSIR